MTRSVADVCAWLSLRPYQVVWMALVGDMPYRWEDNFMVFDRDVLDAWIKTKEVAPRGQ